MTFLDFASFLESEPASLALLATFQFDADFFERRLLRCPSLVKARRIIVFMDAGQWLMMLRQDVPARFLNRRYLVVPVRPAKGVFHPKLSLLLSGKGGRVHCGSNNLTRSGCASNLELLNLFTWDSQESDNEAALLAQEVYRFFQRCCDNAEEETGAIARQWLLEQLQISPWLKQALPHNGDRHARLLHTYEGSLWDRLIAILDPCPPKKVQVISPFYDLDAEMVTRIHRRWPQCRIELVVQQQTTTLPIAPLKKLRSRVSLTELRNSSRRLHAKLISWENRNGTGSLVGSANFTTAAFDGRNVETCLVLTEANSVVAQLFDGQLSKRPLAFEDFEPGTEQPPDVPDGEVTTLRVTSAVLTSNGELRVTYQHKLTLKPSSLRLAIRTADEQRPRALLSLPNLVSGKVTLQPSDEVLKDVHGTILVSLVADLGGPKEESAPVWVIQEGRLTYDASGDSSSASKSKVEETGEGLTEFLEELGKQNGRTAVIEYLNPSYSPRLSR